MQGVHMLKIVSQGCIFSILEYGRTCSVPHVLATARARRIPVKREVLS